MSYSGPRNYVFVETCISAVINIALCVGPAAIVHGIHKASSGSSPQALLRDAVPQLALSGLMSALVPVLLTRRRCRNGRLWRSGESAKPTVTQIVLVAAGFTLLSAAAGAAFILTVFPRIVAHHPGLMARLVFYGVYGALVASTITPLALFLFFGPDWKNQERAPELGVNP